MRFPSPASSAHRLVGTLLTAGIAAISTAQLLEPVIHLTPSAPSYSASADAQSPIALVFPNEADTWQFNLSAFSEPRLLVVSVSDWFTPSPDDYDLFLNDSLVGNSWTGSASEGRVFATESLPGLNLLRIEYQNDFSGTQVSPGGSFYNLDVRAEPPVLLSGSLQLQDTSSPFSVPRQIAYSVKQGNSVWSRGVWTVGESLSAVQLKVPQSAVGTCTLELDGASFLRRRYSIQLTGAAGQMGLISMVNGDVDLSGEVDAADIDLVISDFGSTSSDVSDVDCSGEVDAADIDIVIASFGTVDE